MKQHIIKILFIIEGAMERYEIFLLQFDNIYFAKNFYQMFLVFSNYYKSYNINFITTFSTNKFIFSTALYSL